MLKFCKGKYKGQHLLQSNSTTIAIPIWVAIFSELLFQFILVIQLNFIISAVNANVNHLLYNSIEKYSIYTEPYKKLPNILFNKTFILT